MLLVNEYVSSENLLVLIGIFSIDHFLVKVLDMAKVDLSLFESDHSVPDWLEFSLEVEHWLPQRLLGFSSHGSLPGIYFFPILLLFHIRILSFVLLLLVLFPFFDVHSNSVSDLFQTFIEKVGIIQFVADQP